jgi:predicted nucleic acid-binding protein
VSSLKKVYWDANAWIGLINRDPEKVKALEVFYQAAKRGDVEIWTSVISNVEVYKMKDDPDAPRSLEEQNKRVDEVLHQPFVKPIEVNDLIIWDARNLLQTYPALRKPYDAVHLASALRWDVHAMHTYDRENLLALSHKVKCRNGSTLEICRPEHDPDGALFTPRDDEAKDKP